jgi:hypothetical protein
MKPLDREQIAKLEWCFTMGMPTRDTALELGHSMSTVSKYFAVFRQAGPVTSTSRSIVDQRQIDQGNQSIEGSIQKSNSSSITTRSDER